MNSPQTRVSWSLWKVLPLVKEVFLSSRPQYLIQTLLAARCLDFRKDSEKKNRNLTDLENKSKIVSLSVHLSLSLFVGSIIILEVSSVRPQWTWRSLSNSFLLLFTSTYVCPSFLFSPVYSFVCSFLCWLSRLLLYTRPSTHAFVLVGFSVYSLIR